MGAAAASELGVEFLCECFQRFADDFVVCVQRVEREGWAEEWAGGEGGGGGEGGDE